MSNEFVYSKFLLYSFTFMNKIRTWVGTAKDELLIFWFDMIRVLVTSFQSFKESFYFILFYFILFYFISYLHNTVDVTALKSSPVDYLQSAIFLLFCNGCRYRTSYRAPCASCWHTSQAKFRSWCPSWVDEAGVLEQDSASRLSITCNVWRRQPEAGLERAGGAVAAA